MAISRAAYQSTAEVNPFLFPQQESTTNWWSVLILIVIAGIVAYLIYRRKKQIKRDKIGDQWSTLIEGANGEGEQIIKGVIRAIERVEAPDIFIKRQEISPGRGFITKSRELLVAEHRVLHNYDMYIGARDYGKQLFVSWYLIMEPTSFWRLFKRNPISAIFNIPFLFFMGMISRSQGNSKGEFFSALNVFDTEELTAYVTTVHHAVLETTKELMEQRKLDFTKVDTKSRGFLNIS